MRYLYFSKHEKQTYPVCLLVPTIRKDEIQKAYLEPHGLDPEDLLIIDLHYAKSQKKTPKAEITAYINDELVPIFNDMGVSYIVVADSEYFKALTKVSKVDVNLGYILDCAFGPWKVVYVPNYRTIFYDPEKVISKIAQGIQALKDHRAGTYQTPGIGILKFESYPKKIQEIASWLNKLLAMDCPLAIDIETFSLKPNTAGIGTISFAWSEHEGIAFPVDYLVDLDDEDKGWHGENQLVRDLLRNFFRQFAYKAIYHNIAFDVSVLIYQLFMTDIIDTKGLLDGIDVMLRNWDCTKLISYLATNSCAGNRLSLKDQAQEFAGNYAMGEDIKDITRIPLDKLLRYNLVDACSTWHVHKKHWDTMVADQQLDIYQTIFQPATVDIIQMQLTGLPVNMQKVRKVKTTLKQDEQNAISKIQQSPLVQQFTDNLRWNYVCERNAKLKKKTITINDPEVSKVVFNPKSSDQKQALLYEMLALPVITFTDSKQPSTKAEVLKDLKNHADKPEIHNLLDALLDLASVLTILETFIPALENAVEGPDGWHYLIGNFNLGGTLSARLSSSDPNLQNLPSGNEGYKTRKGQLGKLIKSCIEAPEGWIFVGLDFASLEDRISALTTKDPNKLKVYQGHVVYELSINGEIHHIRDDATVSYDGKNYTGQEFYAAFSLL